MVRGALLAGFVFHGIACTEEAPPTQPPPAQVSYVTVQPQAVTLFEELPGRVSAFRIAEVRARVSGIVLRREFEGGESVQEGEVLYQIDPAPFQAAVDRASAALEQAEAAAALADAETDRYRPLIQQGAISQQLYDSVLAEAQTTAAQVSEARAALREAQLNLGYARVTSPIDGVVGVPLVTVGALVGQGEATLMTRVQQVDRVYVDIQQTSAAMNRMRAAGFTSDQPVTVHTGEPDAPVLEGQLLFSDITVDPGTGEVTLRALVPNPDAFLLPGQFVRARLRDAVRERALLVPQQAVESDASGRTEVTVLDASGKAEARDVVLGDVVEGSYLVEAGLQPGERVVVEGQDKIRPGAPIHATPWSREGSPAVASSEASGVNLN